MTDRLTTIDLGLMPMGDLLGGRPRERVVVICGREVGEIIHLVVDTTLAMGRRPHPAIQFRRILIPEEPISRRRARRPPWPSQRSQVMTMPTIVLSPVASLFLLLLVFCLGMAAGFLLPRLLP